MDVGRTAARLAKNPLGIIALFLVVCYALATGTLAFAGLPAQARLVLVWFAVLFPPLVLAAFVYLVVAHPGNLYGPADFKDERLFVGLLSSEKQRERLQSEVEEESALAKVSPAEEKTAQGVKSSPGVTRPELA